MSSSMTPHPLGNFSSCQIGQGFIISSKRNKINAAAIYSAPSGNTSNPNHCPATSSITILEGSFSPVWSIIIFVANTPIINIVIIRTIKTNGSRYCNHSHQPITAARLPQVPGAMGKCPILKHVASHSDNSTRSNSYTQEINCRMTARFVYRYVKPVKMVNIVTDRVR